jgi:D-alanyl-D-alanine carboxypeptidase
MNARRPRLGFTGSVSLAFVMAVAIVAAGCGTAGPSTVASPSESAPVPRGAMTGGTLAQQPDLQRVLGELAPGPSSGALALVQRPEGIWRGASGQAEGERNADPNDRFAIASTTKTFIGTVVLQLVGEDRLSLDETVEKWLPSRVRDGDRIAIRHLLNHTSGIGPGYASLGAPDGQQPLLSQPGTKHLYSNTNYVILGLIVEAVSGDDLGSVVRERIFRPLRLEHSSYGSASLGTDATNDLPWLGSPIDTSSDSVSGDGGIVSTTDDLAMFFRALLAGELLDDDQLSEMLRTVDTDTDPLAQSAGGDPQAGLGIFGFDLGCGPAWGHGGDMPEYSNQVLASPDGSTIVVVAQNRSGWPQASATAQEMYCAAQRAT